MPKSIYEHEPWYDPIVAEVRQVRQALFAAAGRDLHEVCRRLREEQAKSGHPVVTTPAGRDREKPDDAA